MKARISLSVDEKTILDVRKALRTGKYRNKSHLFEQAVQKMLEEEL